jgi:hypothetical protein
MEKLQELDKLLSQLPSRSAPPGFLEEVMAALESDNIDMHNSNKTRAGQKPYRARRKGSFSLEGWETLRDLALAAAVTLGVFWYGAPWFDSQHLTSAGGKLDLAFKNYVHYSGYALDKARTNIENINGILTKER